jgi:hypothetical protein
MNNEKLLKICEEAYKSNNCQTKHYDLLSHWTGKETDITVMRLAFDLAFNALRNGDTEYVLAFRDIIYAISDKSLENDEAWSYPGFEDRKF